MDKKGARGKLSSYCRRGVWSKKVVRKVKRRLHFAALYLGGDLHASILRHEPWRDGDALIDADPALGDSLILWEGGKRSGTRRAQY